MIMIIKPHSKKVSPIFGVFWLQRLGHLNAYTNIVTLGFPHMLQLRN